MIVILTGAGISQESGFSTFRDTGGLWENERIEDVCTPRGYKRNPEKVLEFYNKLRRSLYTGVNPNPAHLALARLEKESSEPVLVVTQNVDNLHERAGSQNLIHMHGELAKSRCEKCFTVFTKKDDMHREDACPDCGATGSLRPHIVWFEEMPLHMDEIEAALNACSTFVSIGTSGNVYPAAGFSRHARHAGAHTLELNLEPSLGASVFHESRYGKAGTIVPEWVEEVLSAQHKNEKP